LPPPPPPTPLELILERINGVDTSLGAALPHALEAGEGKRHEFEQKVVDAAEGVLLDLEKAARSEVESAEAAVASTGADRAKLETDLEAAKALLAVAVAEKADKASLLTDAERSCEGMAAEKRAQEELVGKKKVEAKEIESKKEDLTAVWEPLKASSILPQQWRERNKKIASLLADFESCGVPESLCAAVGIAFKTKAEERGAFAIASIEAAEKAYQKRMHDMTEAVSAAEQAAVSAAEAAAAAEAAHAEALAREAAAQEASIVAQNAWLEETTSVGELTKTLGSFDGVALERAVALESSQKKLSELSDLLQKFRNHAAGGAQDPAVGAPVAADAPAADDVPADAVAQSAAPEESVAA